MEPREIASRFIDYLRKYDGKGHANPSVFSQSMGCSQTELRSAQSTLLANNVITCIDDTVVPEYKLLEAYREGDEWQKFFPESAHDPKSNEDFQRKNSTVKVIELLQKSGGKITATQKELAERCGVAAPAMRYTLIRLQKKGIIQPFEFIKNNCQGSVICLVGEFLFGDSWKEKFAEHTRDVKPRTSKVSSKEKGDMTNDLGLNPVVFDLNKALVKLNETQKVALELAKEVRRLKQQSAYWKSQSENWEAHAVSLKVMLDERNKQTQEVARVDASNQDLLSKVEDNERELSMLVGSS